MFGTPYQVSPGLGLGSVYVFPQKVYRSLKQVFWNSTLAYDVPLRRPSRRGPFPTTFFLLYYLRTPSDQSLKAPTPRPPSDLHCYVRPQTNSTIGHGFTEPKVLEWTDTQVTRCPKRV